MAFSLYRGHPFVSQVGPEADAPSRVRAPTSDMTHRGPARSAPRRQQGLCDCLSGYSRHVAAAATGWSDSGDRSLRSFVDV